MYLIGILRSTTKGKFSCTPEVGCIRDDFPKYGAWIINSLCLKYLIRPPQAVKMLYTASDQRRLGIADGATDAARVDYGAGSHGGPRQWRPGAAIGAALPFLQENIGHHRKGPETWPLQLEFRVLIRYNSALIKTRTPITKEYR